MKVQELKLEGRKSFGVLAGINRPILPKQVTKLAESTKDMGCIRPVVVCKAPFYENNENLLYILDGQHLFHACLRNKIDVPYVIVEVSNMEELIEKMALLNSSSKSWTGVDYITAWASVNDNYKKLQKYLNIYDLEKTVVAGTLSGSSITGGGVFRGIKRGSYQVVNEKANVALLDKIVDLNQVIKNPRKRTQAEMFSSFVVYYRKISSDYVHEDFISFCKNNKKQLEKCASVEQFNAVFYKYCSI